MSGSTSIAQPLAGPGDRVPGRGGDLPGRRRGDREGQQGGDRRGPSQSCAARRAAGAQAAATSSTPPKSSARRVTLVPTGDGRSRSAAPRRRTHGGPQPHQQPRHGNQSDEDTQGDGDDGRVQAHRLQALEREEQRRERHHRHRGPRARAPHAARGARGRQRRCRGTVPRPGSTRWPASPASRSGRREAGGAAARGAPARRPRDDHRHGTEGEQRRARTSRDRRPRCR